MCTSAPSIGVNLRVTGHCNQGGRKYMEDAFAVAYQQTDDENDLEYAYFGIFDGHGGRDAAIFAKEHLMNAIVSQKCFWSDNDDNVLKAIKEGFVACHMAMWKEVGKWPQTISGLPSTSGTTASVVFIRNGKLYVGHVGDSAIVLGYKDPVTKHYAARSLTSDHKPELPAERKRIEDGGGRVMSKCGVQRVVWNRPRIGHKGPIRRSTHIDQIPFLAVARSLGDLWSYDYLHSQFIVSPEPDVCVVPIDSKTDRCIIVATDGVWNMLSSREAVRYVEAAERENERHFLANDSIPIGSQPLINPSRLLVDKALSLWYTRKKRADNATVLTIMIDPPGPPKSEVLLRKRMLFKLRPREDIANNYSYTSVELMRKSVTVSHEQFLNVNPQPEVVSPLQMRCSPVENKTTTTSESLFSMRPKYELDSRPVISSDYDIWMKGSLCLQRSGGCRLVPDFGNEDDQSREDMWRLAPTPPLPEPVQPEEDVSYSKPRFPFVRTDSIWIRPQVQPLITENSRKSDCAIGSPLCNQIASSSTQCSYGTLPPAPPPSSNPPQPPPPPPETRRTLSNSIKRSASGAGEVTSTMNDVDSPTCSTTPTVPTGSPTTVKPRKVKSLTGVKRKSVPGKRELFFLLAKQSRIGRSHLSPMTLYRGTCTRSKVRLRKSHD